MALGEQTATRPVSVAPASGYGRPTTATSWKTGRFSRQAFPLQPDGTLRYPANQKLLPQERRREAEADCTAAGSGGTDGARVVENALLFASSQGQVEGQAPRLKAFKRQGYGRASPALLQARLMGASDLYRKCA
ncbi:MAG: hypothetical protein ACRDIV_03330 [Ktedonobacteraceae bacterium]